MPNNAGQHNSYFTLEEKEQLKQIFNVRDEEVETLLRNIVSASVLEYKEMLASKGMPTSINDMKEQRLLYLIKKVFNNRIPSASVVSKIFRITESRSRNLIRNVEAKFRVDLDEGIKETLKEFLEKIRIKGFNTDDDIDDICEYWFPVYYRDKFNKLLIDNPQNEGEDIEIKKIKLKQGENKHLITLNTFNRLCEILNIERYTEVVADNE